MARLGRLGIVAAVVVLLVSGCVGGPRYTPYDEGIPEARSAAQAQLAQMIGQLPFTDAVEVLGSGSADSCAIHDSGNVGELNHDGGWFCLIQWAQVVTVPGAQTREQVAAALDAEIIATGLPYVGTLTASLARLSAADHDAQSIAGGAAWGTVRFGASSEPLRAETWKPPYLGNGGVETTDDGLAGLTAAEIASTGATEVITVGITIDYWDSRGLIESPPIYSAPGLTHTREEFPLTPDELRIYDCPQIPGDVGVESLDTPERPTCNPRGSWLIFPDGHSVRIDDTVGGDSLVSPPLTYSYVNLGIYGVVGSSYEFPSCENLQVWGRAEAIEGLRAAFGDDLGNC